MTSPKFSVVLPVKNGERYLASAVDSILKQTYPQFNLLILENCSQDQTLAILEDYHDPRLHIFPAATPLTIEDNWARITSLPLAEYLTIVGHDDLLYPEFLEEVTLLIEAEPDASLYCTHFDLIDAKGAHLRRSKSTPYKETGNQFMRARQKHKRDSYGTGYVMYSKDYLQIGGLPAIPNLLFADDIAFYKLAHLSIKVCSPRTLFAYRYHRQSASKVVDVENLYDACCSYLSILSQTDYYQLPYSPALSRRFVEKAFHRQIHRLLFNLIVSVDADVVQSYKAIKQRLFDKSAADELFSIYDLTSQLLEVIAGLPFPVIRRFVAWMLENMATARSGIRASE